MDLKKIIKGSSFMRDGITLMSGNVWAQVIAFASYLILSRLFSPEDFGFYNVFFSYIEVLVIVSTCKYELAVVLADNDREAAAVSRLHGEALIGRPLEKSHPGRRFAIIDVISYGY